MDGQPLDAVHNVMEHDDIVTGSGGSTKKITSQIFWCVGHAKNNGEVQEPLREKTQSCFNGQGADQTTKGHQETSYNLEDGSRSEVCLEGDGHTAIGEIITSCREFMSATSVGVNHLDASPSHSKDNGGSFLISSCNNEERHHIHRKANKATSLGAQNKNNHKDYNPGGQRKSVNRRRFTS